MSSIKEKIAQNEQKILQLEKNIKRDTEKRKKLIDENERLNYQALCQEFRCSGTELFDMITLEHDQIQAIKDEGMLDSVLDEISRSIETENKKENAF